MGERNPDRPPRRRPPSRDPTAADFTPPPGTVFYEAHPIVTRMVEVEGRLWAVTYFAERDEIGWRVKRADVMPYEPHAYSLVPGDLVDIRCKVQEDHGADVQVRVEDPVHSTSFWVKRSAIIRIHRPSP